MYIIKIEKSIEVTKEGHLKKQLNMFTYKIFNNYVYFYR